MQTVTMNDQEAMARLVQGDELAMESLLERYWEPAYRVAFRFTRDPGTAEDAAQEAFISLLRSANRYQPERSFRPWFFQIVENSARDSLRSRSRREAREVRAARPENSSDERVATTDEVHAHLARLSRKHREALTLHFLHGLTFTEIASGLGCPTGTVASRVRNGLASLRASLAPTGAMSVAALTGLLEAADGPLPAVPSAQQLMARAGGPVAPAAPSAKALLAEGVGGSPRRLSPAKGIALVGALALVSLAVATMLPPEEATDPSSGVAKLSSPPAKRASSRQSTAQEPGENEKPRPESPAESASARTPADSSNDPAPPATNEQSGKVESDKATVAGRVTNENGEPLSGIVINPTDLDFERLADPVLTGVDGSFRITGLRSAPVLHLKDPTHRYSQPPPIDEDCNLIPTPLGNESVNLVMRQRGRVVIRVVSSESGAPLTNVAVEALDPYAKDDEAVTDTRGVCGFWLDAGDHSFRAWKPGFAQRELRNVQVEYGGHSELEITLGAGATLKGVVTSETGEAIHRARLVRVDWREQEKAEKALQNWEGWVTSSAYIVAPGVGGLLTTLTDEHGEFVLQHVPEGHSRILVAAPGYVTAIQDVTIKLPSASSQIEFRLQRTVPQAETNPATGRVFAADTGKPLSAISARLFRQTRAFPTPGASLRLWQLQNDGVEVRSDGGLVFSGLDSGYDYRVLVSASGYARALHGFKAAEGGPGQFELRLQPTTSSLAGRVVGPDGRPREAFLTLRKRGTWETTHMMSSSSDGRFVLEGTGVGAYVLYAAAKGFAPSRACVEIERGKQATVEMSLALGGNVEVEVVDFTSKPRPGAILFLQYPEGELLNEIAGPGGWYALDFMANPQGVITVSHIPPGTYSAVVAYAFGSGPATAAEGQLQVAAGGTTRWRVKLVPVR